MIEVKSSTRGAFRSLLAALTILACLACGASTASALSLAEQAGLAHRFTYSDSACSNPVDPVNVVWEEEGNASPSNRVSVNSVADAIAAHKWPRDEYQSKVFKISRSLHAGDIGYQWIKRTDGLCVRDGRQMSDGTPVGSRFHVRLFSTVSSDGRSFVVGDAHRDQKHQGDGCDTVDLGIVSFGHVATSFDEARNKMAEDWTGSRAYRYWGNTQAMRQCNGSYTHSDGNVLYLGQFGIVTRASAPSPQNTSEPTISGTPKLGSTLTVSPGAWSPNVTSWSYQWCQVNLEDDSCAPYPGATGSSWTPGAGSSGNYVGVMVTPTGGQPVVSNVEQIFSGYPLPVASFNSVTNITETSIMFNGSVNPQGQDGRYNFECGLLGAGYTYRSSSEGIYFGFGYDPIDVHREIGGLTPGATYHCRLAAWNIGNISNPVYTGEITVTTAKYGVSYVTPGAPAPLVQDNGNIDVFNRKVGGDELDFTRALSGSWSVATLTPASQPKMGGSSAVLRMKVGAMHAFAINKSGDIICHYRTGTEPWNYINLSSYAGATMKFDSSTKPSAVEWGPNRVGVYARAANGDLVSLERNADGTWFTWNESEHTNGHPQIAGSPTAVVLDNPGAYANTDLIVFARTSGYHLMTFNRDTSGNWTSYDVSVNTGVSINADPAAVQLDPNFYAGSGLGVYAPNLMNELVEFSRATNGAWTVYNVSKNVPGNPYILGSVAPIRLSPNLYAGSGLGVYARNGSGDLVGFDRGPSGVWSMYNVSATNGFPKIYSSPSVLTLNPDLYAGSGLQVEAINNNFELISFDRFMDGGWQYYNMTANVSGNPKVE